MKAKHPYEGNYSIWKKYLNLRADILDKEVNEELPLISETNEQALQSTEEEKRETEQRSIQTLLKHNLELDFGEETDENDALVQLVKKIYTYIQRGIVLTEAETISAIVDPLLGYLGWDVQNVFEVKKEYKVPGTVGNQYVDIALMIEEKPRVLIEVKALTKILQEKDERQGLVYAFNSGIEWCVLTNGREIRVYNPLLSSKGTPKEKMVLRLSYLHFIKNKELLQLLSREKNKEK